MKFIPFTQISLQFPSVSKRLSYLIMTIFAFIGAALLLFVTDWGISISPDSTVYITLARNLLKGYGFSTSQGSPLTHFPPLYPLLLSLSALWGQDPLDGARIIHVFLFMATLALSFFIIYRETSGSITAAITGLLFLLCSDTVIQVYSYAWSESLFILPALAGLWLLSKYPEESKISLLLGSAVLIGLASSTRYAGVFLIITGFLFILLFSKSRFYRKLIVAACFAAISFLPVFFWLIRNFLVTGTLTDRSLIIHPITWRHLNDGILTVSQWFLLPQNCGLDIRYFVLAIFAVIFSTAYILLFRFTFKTEGNERTVYFPSIFIIFVFSYCIFVGFSTSFIDADITFDDRILFPLYIPGVIAFVCLAYHIWLHYKKSKAVAVSFLLISFSFLTAQVINSVPLFFLLHNNGNGYSSKYWKHSPIIRVIKSLPDDLVIFTNCPDAVEILTGRSSRMLPVKFDVSNRRKNENFVLQINYMILQIENGKAILIYSSLVKRCYLPSPEEIKRNLHVPILYTGWDGFILGTE